ncbi:hypothetical protein UlMin_028345 [Ulmus minor]
MAELLVGGALLSGFINVLFERMAPRDVITKLFPGKKNVAELLDELKIKLRSANVLLNDAEEKQLTSQDVKEWLDDLNDVIYKADFLMDKINNEALKRKMEDESAITIASKFLNFVSTSVLAFEKTVLAEGQEILKKLNLLLDQKDCLGLKEGVRHRTLQSLPAPLVVKESDVYGRDEDKEKIVKLLLFDEASGLKLSVIPIVGLGGVGKTTLAQLVYKDCRVQEHFDLMAWVTVSEEFDVFQITKIIFEKVTSQKCDIGDLFQLQSELSKALAGKKFLFVHDDVWNENYQLWNALKSTFESGAHGSKIIVTTRSKIVASTMGNVAMHELKLVSDEDCWKIFAKHVFNVNANSQALTELQEIGLEIVKQCKGLPLAVISLAGLLRSTSKPEEWRKILNSDIWHLQFQQNLKNNVVPALWLSYQFFPPCLKRCFAYCSIFPKDYQFETKKIIWLWMAEGLLQPEQGKKIEEIGEEYLRALIARSFFQYSSQDESTVEEPRLIMHDIVHDLAMCIASEFSFELGDSNDLHDVPTRARHLSYRKGLWVSTKMKELTSQTNSLRTLLALPLSNASVWPKPILEKSLLNELFLKVGGCLKVLSLSESSVTELPDSIGNMKSLRYLDLSDTEVKEIPDSICTLYNLQTLLLSCNDLAQLPIRITALVNLRHLDIRGTCLKEMPPLMYKMKNLQTLSDFVLGENGGCRIKELGDFPLLQGRLCISGLENIVDVRDVLEANLKDKKFLSELILIWNGDSNIIDSQKEREVLEALQPHTNLKKLRVIGYRGTIFPDWVGDVSFCNMVEVELSECKNCCMLPPLGQLPSLRRLEICGLDGVVSIGNEFCGSSSTTTQQTFRSLEVLGIWRMQCWMEWSFSSDRVGQEGGVFPRLKMLCLDGCGKLIVGLPDCYLPNLKMISISRCYEMVRVCQQMITSTIPSLHSIVVMHCPSLELLFGMSFPSHLNFLGINDCKMLWQNRMNWDLQSLSSLKGLELGLLEVDSFPEEGLLPTTLTSLSIFMFPNLKRLNGRAFQHLTSLQQLTIWECKEVECLPQEGLPISLSYLKIYNCPLLKQRCQRGTGEDWPIIQHIPTVTIIP